MPTTINASNTSGGAVVTGDGSGILELQSGGVTALTANGANVTVAGTLTATGGISGGLVSPATVAGNSTAGAEIRLPEDTDNGSNYVALKAANALAANLTFTLPDADGTSGQLLQTNGSGTLSFATPASGSLLRTTVFTASGTWTKGAGTNFILVSGVGGGAGGGGPRVATTAGAGGGGGGGYFKKLASSLGVSTASVTIGSGGTAQATANTAGNNGGNTTFVYGATTLTGNGGVGGAANTGGGGGGNGGTATNGDLNISGQAGMGGNYPSGTNGLPGTGGSSILGFGGPSNGDQGVKAATGYGAGGTGASGASTGGAGTSGIVIVEEYT